MLESGGEMGKPASCWSYRLVRTIDESGNKPIVNYGIYEVHYNKEGKAWSMQADPSMEVSTEYLGETTDAEARQTAIDMLVNMLSDINKTEVMEEPETWGTPPWEENYG